MGDNTKIYFVKYWVGVWNSFFQRSMGVESRILWREGGSTFLRNVCNHCLYYAKILSFFNVHGSVHRNNILVYKSQQDAHNTQFI